MDKDWIVRALAMHAAMTMPLDAAAKLLTLEERTPWLRERAEAYASLIRDFAQGALNKPADPFA